VDNTPEKIILKDFSLPGVDKSVNDMTLWATHGVIWVKVTKVLYKEKGTAYIGLSERLVEGEVIQAGKNEKLYRIVRFHRVTDRNGNIFKVIRMDNNPITQTDIDAISIGDNVRITSRLPMSERVKLFKTQHHIDE